MSIHVSMWSYKYSLQGIFIPCIFHIFILAKGFALSWICTDTVVIDTEIIKDIGIHSSLKFAHWQQGQRGSNKKGADISLYTVCLQVHVSKFGLYSMNYTTFPTCLLSMTVFEIII